MGYSSDFYSDISLDLKVCSSQKEYIMQYKQ